MIKVIKQTALQTLKGVGTFHVVSRSRWRRNRLLVLCYHGMSLEQEHLWNWGLYMPAGLFERRMRWLRDKKYRILTLEEGLERVRRGDLPERSVAVTFDDGTYDLYSKAWPVIRDYEIPATVYLTTYHCDDNRPIFRISCSYMLWKRRDVTFQPAGWAGLKDPVDLSTLDNRHRVMFTLDRYARNEGLSGADKSALLAELASRLNLDYGDFLAKRILRIMNPSEVKEMASAGVDFQLHTHRHRTPVDRGLFRREIEDNAARIVALTGQKPRHFCYPSGVHRKEFLPWLRELGVESAVTCTPGLVTPSSDWLLLPRILDHALVPDIEFEAWLSGVREMFPKRAVFAQDPDELAASV